MNPWQVLGVEPGSDRKTIKRAYTRQLKDMHPEEKPDEFMQLRQAYEWALKTLDAPAERMVFAVDAAAEPEPAETFEWSDTSAAAPSGHEPATIDDPWTEMPPEPTPKAPTIQDLWVEAEPDAGAPELVETVEAMAPVLVEDDVGAGQERLNQLVAAMARLLDDPNLRNDLTLWEPLLMAQELNDFQASSAVSGWLLPQVIRLLQSGKEECPFEANVLLRFDERFHWSTDNSGLLPVIDDQLLRVCLLIEAARETVARPHEKVGRAWLANTLFSLSGRLSRIECLIGLGMAIGVLVCLTLLVDVLPGPEFIGWAIVAVMLAMCYSLFSLMIKRVRDAGIHPVVALVVGFLFPGAYFFYLLAAPTDSDKYEDPRLKYSEALGRTYREYYVASGKRSKGQRLRERLTGIHRRVYIDLAGLWFSNVVLISYW